MRGQFHAKSDSVTDPDTDTVTDIDPVTYAAAVTDPDFDTATGRRAARSPGRSSAPPIPQEGDATPTCPPDAIGTVTLPKGAGRPTNGTTRVRQPVLIVRLVLFV